MRFAWMIILGVFLSVGQLVAQQNLDPINPDRILDPNIHTVLIHPAGNPLAAPIIPLHDGGTLQISFDDFKDAEQQITKMLSGAVINGVTKRPLKVFSKDAKAILK